MGGRDGLLSPNRFLHFPAVVRSTTREVVSSLSLYNQEAFSNLRDKLLRPRLSRILAFSVSCTETSGYSIRVHINTSIMSSAYSSTRSSALYQVYIYVLGTTT